MTTLYLVRHGEYENPDYLFPGQSREGFPLSETGKRQIQALVPYFSDKRISAIYASPLVRTLESAEIFSESLHVPVTYKECLLEVKTNLEGISMTHFDATNGELSYLPHYQKKGAESMDALGTRVRDCLEEIRKAHEGKTVLVVFHGDPIRFGIMKYMNMPMTFAESRKIQMPLAAVFRLEVEANQARYYPIVAS